MNFTCRYLILICFIFENQTSWAQSACLPFYAGRSLAAKQVYTEFIREFQEKHMVSLGALTIFSSLVETAVKDRFGRTMATISFHKISVLNVAESILWIDYMYVKPEFKKRGLSKLLLATALETHPTVSKIGAELSGTNKSVFGNPSEKDRLSAVKNTPFYKMAASFDFSVVESHSNSGDFSLQSFYLKKSH